MSEQLRQTEEQLKKAKEELLQQQTLNGTIEAEQELQHKLQQAEATIKDASDRAEKAESRSKKMEERILLAKIETGKGLYFKDVEIQKL